MLMKIFNKFKRGAHSSRKRFEDMDGIHKKGGAYQDPSQLSTSQEVFLKNIQRVHEMVVDDLKIPSVDIVAIDSGFSAEKVLEIMRNHPFQFYPVFQKNLDDVIGVMHVRDIAFSILGGHYEIKNIVRDVLFVSASMKILDLLLQMRTTGHRVAMVVDEYGGIDGLITASSIIEELIGETDDEDLLESPQMVRLQDGTFVADARLPLEDFEEQFGFILTDDEKDADLDTLGGLVIYLAGRVPDHREIITHSRGIEFEVLEANPRRVLRLRIRRPVV